MPSSCAVLQRRCSVCRADVAELAGLVRSVVWLSSVDHAPRGWRNNRNGPTESELVVSCHRSGDFLAAEAWRTGSDVWIYCLGEHWNGLGCW